ncbi:hypothetical protein PspLS_03369 [Pyricularia sp. CBS 133598]|nr:hypothetical protein PspLS_03369 [Pyricularia sp. CBS 133598]
MDPARFYHQVEQRVIELQDQISQLASIATVGGERLDATEAIQADIANLTRRVADASDKLPPYDQKHYAEAIKRLTEMLNEELARLHPKPRFKFKPRTTSAITADPKNDPRLLRGTNTSGPDAATTEDVVGALPNVSGGKSYNDEISRPGGTGGIRKPSFSAARTVDIRDHEGLHIILPLTAAKATSSGSLQNMRHCVVDMSEPAAGKASFANLAIRDVDRCLVVAGNVNGPAHITGVRDSVLVVSARQVRIHECRDVRIYLYCSSRPIIEDCEGMKFAPIPASHLSQDQDPTKNQWDQVDDFKWLKADHSPNWAILPEGERLPEDIWNVTVKGRPGLGPKDILRETGVLED